eukprot:PhM_4_TR2086/c1_g1_i5/m.91362
MGLVAIATEIVNDNVDDSLKRRFTRSRLLGIPKPIGGGLRPIAVGDPILKICSIIMIDRLSSRLDIYFDKIQYGIGVRGGAEIIAHSVRERHGQGASILTIDVKNAFNFPERQAIADELYNNEELSPLWPLFMFEYGKESELVVYRHGQLLDVIMSSRGTRQG